MRKLITALLLTSISAVLQAQIETGSIHGIVIDSRNGQNLPNFSANLFSTSNRREQVASQQFDFRNLPPGDYVLQIDAAGFTESEAKFHLNVGEHKEFSVTMSLEAQRKGEVVEVRAGVLNDPPDAPGGSVTSISGRQLLNLSTVLADDPMRAVQALPGVASDNDLEAKFSLRGADFSQVGVFMDGVRVPDALHSFQGAGLAGSASFFDRSMVDELSLYNSPMPERFGDVSAGALDVKLRDGSSDAYHLDTGANFAQAHVSAQGPFGNGSRCAWITGFRKTYLQYLLQGRLPDPSMLFGVQDEQGRATCQANEENKFSLDVVDSLTSVDNSGAQNLQPTAFMKANQHTDLINLGWMFTPTDKWLITTHAAYIRNSFAEVDASNGPLGHGSYSERALYSTAEYFPNEHIGLSAGVDTRGMQADGSTETRYAAVGYIVPNEYAGSANLWGGFLQQSFLLAGGRVHIATSERRDHDSADKSSRFSPAASVNVRVVKNLEVQAGWGEYAQYPDVSITGSLLGGARILPIESKQETAGLALWLNGSTTLRVTVYQRADSNLPFQPWLDPRLIAGKIFLPPQMPYYENSLSGKARGYEATLQRRSKRLSGFVSFSHGYNTLTDSVTHTSFPSDWDQRNTVTAYLDYGWRANIDLSSRYTYGSGFPIAGFLRMQGTKFYFSDERNALRLPPYQSLDMRMNKAFPHERWRWNLYLEVVNATNHSNEAWGGITGFVMNPRDWLLVSKLSQFPILPSVGMEFQF